jgi:succinate dehydrogenase / fumarate reductase iron-sulfur subunit
MSTVLEDRPATPDVIQKFTATVMIRRFNPEVDSEPFWQEFSVQMLPTDRVLDALHQIKWEQDGSLTFRRSCAHGVATASPARR